jgi:thiol-disulfide isomerase/thioredoxin
MLPFSVRFLCLTLALEALFSCSTSPQSPPDQAPLPVGRWRVALVVQEQELPFLLELEGNAVTGYEAYLRNGEEAILIDSVVWSGDSLRLPMPVFDTELVGRVSDGRWEGAWRKNYADNYALPFAATYGDNYRFVENATEPTADFGGRWSVQFADDTLRAVGEFTQDGARLTGSFLTSTGDYRYLAGNVKGDQMMLSAFDGEHAFLFHATPQEDGTLRGDFWSGRSYHTTWTAKRDEDATLADADQLTYLKEGYDRLAFTFPDLNGEPVSLDDPQYQDKVVLVQLFGTWCPNCLDETRFLTRWYDAHQAQDVAVIALAYEQKDDFDYAAARVRKLVDKLDVNYDFLIAGTADKAAASRTLPMLNRIMSFPTLIVLDRNHNVHRIHTGFSGPGTGAHYDEFVQEFEAMMEGLLAEGA